MLEKDDVPLLEEINEGVVFFKRYVELLEVAQMRLLVAGSAALVEGRIR
jgi:hypothetical protein